ncbi:hypothetical protein [Pseudomonas extremaustralis]|uniref:hypothetical protein n=1 Tax=Pseudomonas extremaustralis TaxID=359110 RepID=UPI0023080AF6|nr:hypothetical protein [Pseudomonas extremaustralis]MDB1108124.1 hypothetical protein [Pseudomonas extremaustralis]
MTTNQTIDGVPRELLERAAKAIEKHHGSLQWVIASELRALLDAPAETEAVHEVQWNSIHGPEGWKVVDAPTYHRCTGPLWDRRITHKPAAQPQGEPVAWMQPNQGGMCISNEVKQHSIKLGGAPASAVAGYSIPLYASPPATVAHTMKSVMKAICSIDGFPMLTSNQCHAVAEKLNEQPAPVAVVLPEPMQDPGPIAGLTSRYAQGWNACVDEATRLNAKSR